MTRYNFAVRALTRVKLALVALFILAAPTVGDIGSCGQDVAELDPAKFFAEKKFIDCRQCTDCELVTQTCERACSAAEQVVEFDEDCFPLVHDGEVCLNALRAASCDDYALYVDDAAPTVPTECNFCPVDEKPQ